MTELMIHGPNLTDQSKGDFHAHAADCGDNAHYGHGGKYGGETGWKISADSLNDAAGQIYADFAEFDDDPTPYEDTIWIAPCVKFAETETGPIDPGYAPFTAADEKGS